MSDAIAMTAEMVRPTPGTVVGIDYLHRQGSRETLPLVLLHGIGSNARSYESLMAALPPSQTIIAWNAPGYAASTPLAVATPTPGDYAASLARLLDALDFKRVILVGHSLGCLFAASFAAQDSSRVASLALMSPALGYRVAPGEALPAILQARIDELKSLGPRAFADKRAARLVHNAVHKPQVLAAVREAMASVNPTGYAQAVRALGAGDLLADAAHITAPTLVMVGAEDVVTPPANAHAAYDALTHPTGYHEVTNAGHALPQEDPAVVARLLTQLIEHSDV